jgi:ComF family protein
VKRALQAIADFLIDETCHACRRPVEAAHNLPCPSAAASVALDGPLTIGFDRFGIDTRPLCRACCHVLVPSVEPTIIGTQCANGSIALTSGGRIPAMTATPTVAGTPLMVWPAFETDDRLLSVIHALKFSRRERLAPWLAGSLVCGLPAHAFPERRDDVVLVPIPMDRAALRRRGFNQAERLASAWGEATGIQVERRAVVKTRSTAPQSSLGRDERVHNVVGAMGIGNRDVVSGKCVILVDDLVTTGATAAACAVALWSAGARDVRVGCVGYRP